MVYDVVCADLFHARHDATAWLYALIRSISVTMLVDMIIRTFGSAHVGGAALAKLTLGVVLILLRSLFFL